MIKADLQKGILSSLKEKKQLELRVLRFLLSLLNYEEIAKQRALKDEEVVALFQKEIKKRKEAIELFKKGKRDDLVSDEEKQLLVIQNFLPQQLSEEELNKIIDEIITSMPDEKNVGEIVGMVVARVKGKADGARVANLVKQKMMG